MSRVVYRDDLHTVAKLDGASLCEYISCTLQNLIFKVHWTTQFKYRIYRLHVVSGLQATFRYLRHTVIHVYVHGPLIFY
jgi:hypothetical protein